MSATITKLCHYPIKGFTTQTLDRVELLEGGNFPGDRLMAVEDGPSGFDPEAPSFVRKGKFTVLARSPALARIRTHYAQETRILTATAPMSATYVGNLGEPFARTDFAKWLTACLARLAPGEFTGPLRLIDGFGHHFTDHPRGHISILNLNSVRDLATRMGVTIDPARFRANVHIEGWAAWSENDWTNRKLRIGEAEGRIFAPIVRCAATCADPISGVADHDIPAALHSLYGHLHCGVYARVESPGEVRVGDGARLL